MRDQLPASDAEVEGQGDAAQAGLLKGNPAGGPIPETPWERDFDGIFAGNGAAAPTAQATQKPVAPLAVA